MSRPSPNPGVWIYAIASLAAGIFDLVWREFEPAHQPIQAWRDNIPGVRILASIAAIWLIAGGVAIMSRRTTQLGAALLGIIYLVFAAFWLPRFYTAPHVLGFNIPIICGLLGGISTQLILIAAAALVYFQYSARSIRAARWVIGLSSVAFGLAHLTGVQANAVMVPNWMPFGGAFWTILTGICFVLAGLAILFGILDVLAARMLALMLAGFSAVALLPNIFTAPRNHVTWGANAYNFTAVGAVLIFASALALARRQTAS